MSLQVLLSFWLGLVWLALPVLWTMLFPLMVMAIFAWLMERREEVVERAILERVHLDRVEKEQDELLNHLRCLQEEVASLYYALRGTTMEELFDRWIQCGEFGIPVLLPEAHRPFEIEREGIIRGLKHLESKPELERVDVEFYQTWLEDLWSRFRLFQIRRADKRRNLEETLFNLYDMHEKIAECSFAARFTPEYQRFRGMLHIVEMMVDDDAVSPIIWDYMVSLSKQQRRLLSIFLQSKS